MSNISGWVGPLKVAPDLATTHIANSGSDPADRPSGRIQIATGAFGGCAGSWTFSDGSLSVAISGQPLWRTKEAAVASADSPARALLAGYRIWGEQLLDHLYGSFVFAVIDHNAASALLAVDRLGIEKLAYATGTGNLIFSTSAEVVAQFPGSAARIRHQALLSYIYFHMIPSPETVFEGVHKLPPATALEWKGKSLREFTYWKPQFSDGRAPKFEELKGALHSALTTAVRESKPTERSGAFLSGGLDSSTVAGFLAKEQPGSARTFSIGFGFEEYDELNFARMANRQFNCRATEYVVAPDDIVDLLPRIARAYDEPFGNASAIPVFCCARLALENGVEHLLAGDGGDELFAGNKRYAEQRIFERYQRVPQLVRSLLLEPILGSLPAPLRVSVLRKGRNYIEQAKTPLPDRFENWNFLHRLGFASVLHPELRGTIDLEGPLKHMRSVFASAPDAPLVDRMLYYDWRFTLADNDLRKVQRMCELAGVRVSYPMLHQDVVDVSTQVPADLKMQGTHLRTFYKRAMGDFLPEKIINKEKHGFGLPFGLWLQRSERLADQIDSALAGLRTRNIIEPKFIDRLRALHNQDDAHYYGVLIFTLAMLEQWFQEHRISP